MELDESLYAERARRAEMWSQLLRAGGPTGVSAKILNDLKIFYGGRGIWVDQANTKNIAGRRVGVTVGVLHSGSAYDDDLFDDGALYHYPNTLVPGRDASEISATKAARELQLPVFYTILNRSTGLRDVKLSWVEDQDDQSRKFLLKFGDTPPHVNNFSAAKLPFILTAPRDKEEKRTNRTKRYPKFKFDVLRYYRNAGCCVCQVSLPRLIDAAHIVDVQHNGTDDERNGLMLCANHHRAFDAQLFAIEPSSLRLSYAPSCSATFLGVTKDSLVSLPNLPHDQALAWRWERWKKKWAL